MNTTRYHKRVALCFFLEYQKHQIIKIKIDKPPIYISNVYYIYIISSPDHELNSLSSKYLFSKRKVKCSRSSLRRLTRKMMGRFISGLISSQKYNLNNSTTILLKLKCDVNVGFLSCPSQRLLAQSENLCSGKLSSS